MERKRKKKDKQRGMRTHGKGNTKNKRGAGSRGGRGRAGSHKHKFTKYHADFGGTKAMKARKKKRALNLSELESLLLELLGKKRAEEKGGEFHIDGKKARIGKVLSRGKVEKKLVLWNIKASKKAMEKISAAGGRVEGAEVAVEEEPAGGETGEAAEEAPETGKATEPEAAETGEAMETEAVESEEKAEAAPEEKPAGAEKTAVEGDAEKKEIAKAKKEGSEN